MAEALVKFFLQRLNSLLLHETEIFSGLEHQMEWLINTLGDIGKFSGDLCCTKSNAAACNWINELRDIIRDMDDLIDEFVIQMEQQKSSHRSALTKCFTNGLQEIESRLARTVRRMTELKNSTTVKEDNEYDKSTLQAIDDCQTSVHGNPAAIGGEQKDNKENSREMEDSQTAEAKDSITIGEEDDDESSHEREEGQTSSSVASLPVLNYTDLPYYLQYSLMYCCVFPENYWISKGKLIRLMVAEGLIQEKAGQLMEDTAEENIRELISQRMLELKDKHPGDGVMLTVNPHYREFILSKMKEENFITACVGSHSGIPCAAHRVSVHSDITAVAPHLNNVRPRSLLFLGSQDLSRGHGNWLDFKGAKFLRILYLDRTKIGRLPDEVGDLIHLTYLGLKHTDINELPARLEPYKLWISNGVGIYLHCQLRS